MHIIWRPDTVAALLGSLEVLAGAVMTRQARRNEIYYGHFGGQFKTIGLALIAVGVLLLVVAIVVNLLTT